MALFRAVPTFARCSYRALLSRKIPLSASFTTHTGQVISAQAKRVRPHGKESELEIELRVWDSWRRPKPTGTVLALLGAFFICVLLDDYERLKKDKAGFITCRLVAKEPISSTASIFYLDPNPPEREHWLWQLVSPVTSYVKYALKAEDADTLRRAWREGTVWNVEFKQPQLQIVRSYTPLPPSTLDGKERRGCLKFLIRNEPKGEMSSYLHTLADCSDVDVRGPNHEFRSGPDVRQVVFFAGGTGIAPALQAAHALLGENRINRIADPTELVNRKVHILWANRTRSDCVGGRSDSFSQSPSAQQSESQSWSRSNRWAFFTDMRPRKDQMKPSLDSQPLLPPTVGETLDNPEEQGFMVRELEALKQKYPGQVTVEYFVDEDNIWIDQNTVSNALSRLKDGETSDSQQSVSLGQRQVLISGPPGFISYLAGPKEWQNGREQQGPLGGLISTALSKVPQDVTIWKI